MRFIRKADRRNISERRLHTRAGRRQEDPIPAAFCRKCGSTDIAIALLDPGDRTLKCRACDHTWFARSRKTTRQ
jgi:hypothetical protein